MVRSAAVEMRYSSSAPSFLPFSFMTRTAETSFSIPRAVSLRPSR